MIKTIGDSVRCILFPLLLFSKPFEVATYNVENIFDAEYVGTEYDDYRQAHN